MINRVNIRTWSILGMRGTFGSYLEEIAGDNEEIVALTADLCITSGLARFFENYPDRSYNIGIAEGNMFEIAAGMADEGKIPFATTFSNFAALRSCEQMRHFMGYMNCNVKAVGLGAGFSMELFGNTHYALEDIAVVRSLPNIVLLSPSDGLSLVKCVDAAAKHQGPVYIRLTGIMNHPIVYKEDFDFEIGKACVPYGDAEDGKALDAVIFATGSMVHPSVKAAKSLEKKGVRTVVVDMHTISPIDRDIIAKYSETGLYVTVEEHRIRGGLGSAVAEELALNDEIVNKPSLLKLGCSDEFKKAGTYAYMLQQNRLEADAIEEDIINRLESVKK